MEEYKATNLAENLKWHEHIRKRPGMYLGQVNHKGYVDSLKKLITQMVKDSGCNTVRLLFKDKLEGAIEFDNIQSEFRKDISIINQKDHHNAIDLPILNGLSEWMNITFDSDENAKQEFKKGKTESEPSKQAIKCKKMKIAYSLDKSIWGDEFTWNSNYLSYELREFCYLNPNVKFEITEKIDDFSNTNTYKFGNGLSDRLEIEILNGIGICYFKHHFTQETENFKLEAAFAFRQYSVDQTFIRTYVNNEITPENGSHLDGLLKGLTYGVMKHFQAQNLINDYKISEKGMQQGLVCLINIKMDRAVFSGCVKNKLANSEIIEPIANFVSELLYDSILEDMESTEKLIDKFKMGKV